MMIKWRGLKFRLGICGKPEIVEGLRKVTYGRTALGEGAEDLGRRRQSWGQRTVQ